MSTQDPYGTSDQPPRTGSSPSGSSPGSQPSWQQSAPSGPSGQGYPAGPQQGGYQQPAPYQDDRGAQGGYPAHAGQGGYDRPAPKNGVGLTALVLGIIGLVLSIIPAVGALFGVLGLVAIILGVVGLRRVKRGEATNRGAALTGIITGALAILVSAVWLVLVVIGIGAASDCSSYLSSNDQAGYQQCIDEQVDQLSS